MKDEEVVFTENSIHFKDNPKSIIMSSVAKSLMEMYSHIVCQNGGDVLDVGFGMGFSANKMSELANTYTCIEINPQIYEKALEWAKDKPNVKILFGNWIDVIPTLNKKFDGIFTDTHSDENYKKFEAYCKNIANENCVLSMFGYASARNPSELNHYTYKLSSKNTHAINWTFFINGNFIKKDNHAKFKSPSYLI